MIRVLALVCLSLSAVSARTDVYFSPNGGATAALVKEIGAAKASVWVQAYSFTSQPILDALGQARARHLDVRVLLDKSYQNEAPKAFVFLSESGVPVLIDGRHAIAHNKVLVIDGKTVVTGSFNFTYQAEHMNAENTLVIKDVKVAGKYAANWLGHAAHSVPAIVIPSPAPAETGHRPVATVSAETGHRPVATGTRAE